MPISSVEIAQLNGGYQSMAMSQMAHANMLGQQGPSYGTPYSMGGPSFGSAAIGGVANTIQGIAMPAASLGLGMMGLDPFSMGIKGAMGGFAGGGGMTGAVLGGAGMFAAAAAPMMAASYAGNQMMMGAQQQQQLGGMMNANYGHFLNSSGRMGFGRSDIGSFGSTLRQMSTEQGSMGQMVGFEELGRLAANMGRMGMDQGVRNVKDFTDRFKKMVKTLKTIAEEMGTSLEQAQEMMGAMKQSGIFKNQGAWAKGVRNAAATGGLATSEVTAMMNIGSQISRSVGGRGSAGALGGMQAITNIGAAQQMGLMSEEDVYNVTGLSGAEGRQAMATRMMQMSAQFLTGRLGKIATASLAGAGGKADEGAIQDLIYGGGGPGGRAGAYAGVARAGGYAGFLRNQGRIRGDIMGQLGGLAGPLMMKKWLEERGYDMESDSTKLFMQQQMPGMGTEDIDQMMKIARNLPQLIQARDTAANKQDWVRKIQRGESHRGFSGIKHKFDKAIAEVNAGLQQTGADFMDWGANLLDRWANTLTGEFNKRYHANVAQEFQMALRSGAEGQQMYDMYFGGGNLGSKILGNDMSGGSFMGKGVAKRGFSPWGAKGPNNMGGSYGMAAAGLYGSAGSDPAQQQLRQRAFGFGGTSMAEASNVAMAYAQGGAGLEGRERFVNMGQSLSRALIGGISAGTVSGFGDDRLQSFEELLSRRASTDEGARAALNELRSSGSKFEKHQKMAAILSGAGLTEGEAKMFSSPESEDILAGASKFRTAEDRYAAVGKALIGGLGGVRMRGTGQGSGPRPRGFGAFGEKYSRDTLATGEKPVASITSMGASVYSMEAGKFIESDTGQQLAMQMMSANKEVSNRSALENRKRMAALRQNLQIKSRDLSLGQVLDVTRNRDEKGELYARMAMDVAQQAAMAIESGDDAALKKVADDNGMTVDQVRRMAEVGGAIAFQAPKEKILEAGQFYGEVGRKQVSSLGAMGILTPKAGGKLELSGDAMSRLGKVGTMTKGKRGEATTAQRVAMAHRKMLEIQSTMGQSDDWRVEEAKQATYRMINEKAEKGLTSMTPAEIRAYAEEWGGGGTQMGRGLLTRANQGERLAKGGNQGVRAFAEMAGGGFEAGQVETVLAGLAKSQGNMFKKGDRGKALAQQFLLNKGLTVDDIGQESYKALSEGLDIMGSGTKDKGQLEQARQKIDTAKKGIQEADKEARLKGQEEQNPLLAKIAGSLTQIEGKTKDYSSHFGQVVGAINASSKTDDGKGGVKGGAFSGGGGQ